MGKGTLMKIKEQIEKVYPELADDVDVFMRRVILIQDDSDGKGEYLAEWNYSKPKPEGLKLGK
jgi:hypothetical protein